MDYQNVISLQNENSALMDKKIEELTKVMTKERQQIYKTVKVCTFFFIISLLILYKGKLRSTPK